MYDPICSKVTDYLFMGSETVASDLELLKRNGITHIINASYQCQNFFEDNPEKPFVYKKFPLRDNPSEDISLVFNQVIEFIEMARSSGGKVFIHCQMGVSRSPCLCMLWVMKTTRCSLEEASDHIRVIRPISRPNAGFQLSLLNWAIKEGIQAPNSHRCYPNSNPFFLKNNLLDLDNEDQQQQPQPQPPSTKFLNPSTSNSFPQNNNQIKSPTNQCKIVSPVVQLPTSSQSLNYSPPPPPPSSQSQSNTSSNNSTPKNSPTASCAPVRPFASPPPTSTFIDL
eukprot:gene2402-2969_t